MCLHFETVTAKNRGAVERLALLPEQAGFIESPSECLREADASDFWRPVGIYDGTELVGFAMYGYLPFLGEGQLWFDRLLIDKVRAGAMPKRPLPLCWNGFGRSTPAAGST